MASAELIAVQTRKEYREIAELCAEFSKESRFVQVDPEFTAAYYEKKLQEGNTAVFALRKEGRIIGGLGASIGTDFHNGDRVAYETFWFVHPEHRGEGLTLFKAFEQWGKAMGCQQLQMVHMVDSMPKALERYYVSQGYQLMEKHYMKEVR